MRLRDSVTVSAPVEKVFDGWAALERAPEHQKPTVERTRLTHGPLGVGTRYLAVDRFPGRTVSFEMEITAYQRPTLMAARWEEPMNGSWTARFFEDGAGTRMEFETTIEPTGLMGLLEPLLRPWGRRTLTSGLDSFRMWVEGGSHPPPLG
jgi:uncharacterized protein YndB with AHSA1/START domain